MLNLPLGELAVGALGWPFTLSISAAVALLSPLGELDVPLDRVSRHRDPPMRP